jgi:hypothetical protein
MFIFYRQNIQTMIKDITVAKEKIKTNGMVVDGRRYKIDFTGLTFSVISNTLSKTGHACFGLVYHPVTNSPL